jgi:hypothetical protein
MRTVLTLIGIVLVVFSCSKERDDDFSFEYRIIRTQYCHDPRSNTSLSRDSFIYYYDNQDRLLKTEVCWSKDIIENKYVEYAGDKIKTSYGEFILNKENRIIRFNYNLNKVQTFEYKNNHLDHMTDGQSEEVFYFYNNDDLISDSTIFYASSIESYIHVNNYSSHDSLASDIMVNYYGLHEYPKLNTKLIKEIRTSVYDRFNGNIIRKNVNQLRYTYNYSLSDTLIIEDINTIDVLHNEVFEVTKNIYKIERQ